MIQRERKGEGGKAGRKEGREDCDKRSEDKREGDKFENEALRDREKRR